jgi:hypothetical protein
VKKISQGTNFYGKLCNSGMILSSNYSKTLNLKSGETACLILSIHTF